MPSLPSKERESPESYCAMPEVKEGKLSIRKRRSVPLGFEWHRAPPETPFRLQFGRAEIHWRSSGPYPRLPPCNHPVMAFFSRVNQRFKGEGVFRLSHSGGRAFKALSRQARLSATEAPWNPYSQHLVLSLRYETTLAGATPAIGGASRLNVFLFNRSSTLASSKA